ncbi:MAG: alpha/beta fold hydrolase [Candidatus Cryptobacteroides sp.]|nr:alpha/beta fold hydrolase [Candidatus Cryptobacteroides sp.]
MKKYIISAILLFSIALFSHAQTGTWSGKLDVQGTKISLVFHLDEENPTMDSPDQGAKGIPIEVTRTAAGSITIKVPSIGATYEGLWLIKQIAGTFKQMGASLPLTLTPGEEKLNRPQTPKGPFPYAQEEVSFANGDAVLKGTLVLPEGYSRKTPVLVMVTGSGLQNRDEEIYEHKPFAVIADALARAGIATLRYDDRGFGESTGDLVHCTTEDMKNDALAGIGLLRERFDRVGVIGHSEGGTIALMLAAENKADFIVSLSGMVVSGKETLLWQNRVSLAAAGIPAETIDSYCKALETVFDASTAGMPLPSTSQFDLPAALSQNLSAVMRQISMPYLKHFVTLDVRPLLGVISCPVLALNGTKDMQVEAESNLRALRSGLPDNPCNKLETVEGVNHMFQHCQTGMTTEYRDIEETFAPEVLETLVEWFSKFK